jgi:cellulose synthase/poly-beta-1,6-N-acetylglucosamine synthase-like glycosyltransferase
MAREDVALTRASMRLPLSSAARPSKSVPSGGGGEHVTLSAGQRAVVGLLTVSLVLFGALNPGRLVQGVYWTFVVIFAVSAAIRLAAVLTPRRRHVATALVDDALPHYSLIVPLYREAEVASELVANLDRLDYPRDRLQALIVLEVDDHATQAAFHALDFRPSSRCWSCRRASHAPSLAPATPRLNARGRTDRHLRRRGRARSKAAARGGGRFAAGHPRLACLQAPLRIETPRATAFIPEQFRLEYAAHFEVLLPAFARWRLPFPLGGTSNHFKADLLRSVGGWDSYNVTEDADIGFRLAAAGYHLGTIDRPTLETAPASLKQWGPQRARWIKGHLQTLAVHGRDIGGGRPRALIALIMTLAVPVTASNLHAPAMLIAGVSVAADWTRDGVLSIPGLHLMIYAACWSISAVTGAVGVIRSGGAPRSLHLFGMVGYWMMWAVASPRALWQFFFAPHRWDKTSHVPRTGPRTGRPRPESVWARR